MRTCVYPPVTACIGPYFIEQRGVRTWGGCRHKGHTSLYLSCFPHASLQLVLQIDFSRLEMPAMGWGGDYCNKTVGGGGGVGSDRYRQLLPMF
jgi:hypothetical protein